MFDDLVTKAKPKADIKQEQLEDVIFLRAVKSSVCAASGGFTWKAAVCGFNDMSTVVQNEAKLNLRCQSTRQQLLLLESLHSSHHMSQSAIPGISIPSAMSYELASHLHSHHLSHGFLWQLRAFQQETRTHMSAICNNIHPSRVPKCKCEVYQ